MNLKKVSDGLHKLNTSQIIALGFAGVIFVGGLILWMPFCSAPGQAVTFPDAVFTAATSVCVTGLSTVVMAVQWSPIGKAVILCLIQIGGIGLIALANMIFISLRRKISLKNRRIIKESYNLDEMGGVVAVVRSVVKCVFLAEGIGAVLYAFCFVPEFGIKKGLVHAIFLAVSAFCNAGIDLFGETSLSVYVSNPLVNITTIGLIIVSGLGFIVWDDIWHNRLKFRKYSLHSKIVIISTTVLVFGSAILFGIFEHNNTMAGMNPVETVLASLFASVTTRTAGFNTIDLGAMTQSSKLLTDVLMFIGGSPGSTAGGIKTTSIVVMICYIGANLNGIQGVNILGRRISEEDVKKASVVMGINMGIAVVALIAITAVQPFNMDDLLLEVFSAIGTVGLSTGLTRQLTTFSKFVIIFLMYCGRIGSTTFATSFIGNKRRAPVQYPVEHINVG